MTASRGINTARLTGGRSVKFTIRLAPDELAALTDLAARYSKAKGLPRPASRTALIHLGLARVARSFPAPKQA